MVMERKIVNIFIYPEKDQKVIFEKLKRDNKYMKYSYLRRHENDGDGNWYYMNEKEYQMNLKYYRGSLKYIEEREGLPKIK